jgi:hypothetical protein
MNKITLHFNRAFPTNADTIKFVDSTLKLSSVECVEALTDSSLIDKPFFKEITIPKELVYFIYKRGCEACVHQLTEDLHANT